MGPMRQTQRHTWRRASAARGARLAPGGRPNAQPIVQPLAAGRVRQFAAKEPLKPKDLRARNTDFLIANPRLEFRVTHTKRSPLKISNREYIAVFRSDFAIRPSAAKSPLKPKHL